MWRKRTQQIIRVITQVVLAFAWFSIFHLSGEVDTSFIHPWRSSKGYFFITCSDWSFQMHWWVCGTWCASKEWDLNHTTHPTFKALNHHTLAYIHQHVQACTKHVPACTSMYQHAPAYMSMHQVVMHQARTSMYQHVPTCTNVYQHVPACSPTLPET